MYQVSDNLELEKQTISYTSVNDFEVTLTLSPVN